MYFLLDGPIVDGSMSGSFSITGLPGCTRGSCANGNPVAHVALYGMISGSTPAVPEPGTLALLGLGLLGLVVAHRRKVR